MRLRHGRSSRRPRARDELDGGGERIVVFLGADHVAPMRHFFEANLDVRAVEASEHL